MTFPKPFYSNIKIHQTCLQKIPNIFPTNVYIACSMSSPAGYEYWDSIFPNGYTVINFSNEDGPCPITLNNEVIAVDPQSCDCDQNLLLSYLKRNSIGLNSTGYYLEWTDHSADTDYELLYFLAIYFAKHLPSILIIQCGAGLGRSATFAAMLICAYLKLTGTSMENTRLITQTAINKIRQIRSGSIYRRSQCKLIHNFVKHIAVNDDAKLTAKTFNHLFNIMVMRWVHSE